jgi:phosphoadenosine phosphosulfate reductase
VGVEGEGEAAMNQSLIDQSIELIRTFEPSALDYSPEGYWLAFSGGKDSCVLLDLAKRAGVKFKAVYNVTTIDPPELVRFIKRNHPEVIFNKPKRTFWRALIDSHGIPTRRIRWCCAEFKERGGNGYMKLTGIRASESPRRAKTWTEVTDVWNGLGKIVNPILRWSEQDVWEYIRERKLPYCSLYDEGWKRLGCIGCPLAGKARRRAFARWPRYEKLWRWAVNEYWERRHGKLNRSGKLYYCTIFKSGNEMFEWWMSDKPRKAPEGWRERYLAGLEPVPDLKEGEQLCMAFI